MDIREPDSVREYRAGRRVVAACWRTAFTEIVSDEALDRIDQLPTADTVADRFAELNGAVDALPLVAVVDGAVVGTLVVVWGDKRPKDFARDTDAEVQSLYVHPDHWRSGIASGLLEAAIERLPARIERLVLETFTENDAGRAFYEAQGFEVVGSTTFSVAGEGYPTVVYARSL